MADAQVVTDSDVTSFDYAGFAEVDREWLRNAAVLLGASLRRSVAAIIESGKVLHRARKRLGRGKWEPWLASEAQVPVRSASRLISVHRVFSEIDPKTLTRFTPTALYTLAEPGVPQSIREYAVEQAAGGFEVTATLVNQWVTLQRDTLPLARKDVAELATKDDRIKEEYDADKIYAAENWASLLKIFGDDNSLHLTRVTDVENGDRVISGTVTGRDGRRTATDKTVEAVVLQLAGEFRAKKCRGKCGETKPLDKYSKRVDSTDGRNHYCLECERSRVKAYERVKAEARKVTVESGAM